MLQILSKLRQRAEDEKGFTLIELLVVVLIIGILAAIALPTFLGQRAKAQDASAKSNARNMVSHVESCYANTQDYTQCTQANLQANDQVPAGAFTDLALNPAAPAGGYTIVATSKSGTTFTITRDNAGNITRTCSQAGKGACPSPPNW
jgi:type IV pilus assembly protein PilA